MFHPPWQFLYSRTCWIAITISVICKASCWPASPTVKCNTNCAACWVTGKLCIWTVWRQSNVIYWNTAFLACRTLFNVAFTFEERVMEQLVEGVHCSACSVLPFAQAILLSCGTSAFSTPNTAIETLLEHGWPCWNESAWGDALCADMNTRSQGTMKILLVVNMVSVCLEV